MYFVFVFASVQHNGGFLPGIILLTQCYYILYYFNFPYFCTMCGLEKLGIVDQNWLERIYLSDLLLRTLVVGRRQQSESIEAALDME